MLRAKSFLVTQVLQHTSPLSGLHPCQKLMKSNGNWIRQTWKKWGAMLSLLILNTPMISWVHRRLETQIDARCARANRFFAACSVDFLCAGQGRAISNCAGSAMTTSSCAGIVTRPMRAITSASKREAMRRGGGLKCFKRPEIACTQALMLQMSRQMSRQQYKLQTTAMTSCCDMIQCTQFTSVSIGSNLISLHMHCFARSTCKKKSKLTDVFICIP